MSEDRYIAAKRLAEEARGYAKQIATRTDVEEAYRAWEAAVEADFDTAFRAVLAGEVERAEAEPAAAGEKGGGG